MVIIFGFSNSINILADVEVTFPIIGPIMIELINHIKNGRPPIFGDGTNLRTMSYIDNTVEAILLAINNDKTNGNTYWIGDERPYRLVDVYNEFAKQLNVKIKPVTKLPIPTANEIRPEKVTRISDIYTRFIILQILVLIMFLILIV